MNAIKVFTVGVYGFSEFEFFQVLKKHNINVFIDIRLRRGMRGKPYAFVNSLHLQDTLEHLGMRYVYAKQLAPSQTIRALQKEQDLKNHTTKQKREELSEPFVQAYKTTCLERLDASQFVHAFDPQANLLLFCVESRPEGCHRSLVAEKLSGVPEVTIHHILR